MGSGSTTLEVPPSKVFNKLKTLEDSSSLTLKIKDGYLTKLIMGLERAKKTPMTSTKNNT
jgi:hypothetical protein